MVIDLRVPRQDSWDDVYRAFQRAFGDTPEPSEERRLWDSLSDLDRFVGAWDGDECVGNAGSFAFRITVPGGRAVPAAAVTAVGVSPTHRRRGVLTALQRRQLDDIRSWGEPLAVLTASESVIYGRFGYGLATQRLNAEIDTGRVTLSVPPGTDDVRLRYADPAKALDACEAVYARVVPTRPGMVVRQPGWERLGLLDPADRRGEGSALQCVVAERDGEVTGYTRFRVKPGRTASGAPDGTVTAEAVEGVDVPTRAALWRFLFGIDLTSTLVAPRRPVDEAWQYQVSDIRRCLLRVGDELYVRLVDVGAALEARSYRSPVDVVLDVEDSFCPWNEGRWRLTGDAEGASCSRTREAADLSLSVRELGAAYLGGTPLAALAAAGLVRELRPGALAEAASAFASPVAPWLPHLF